MLYLFYWHVFAGWSSHVHLLFRWLVFKQYGCDRMRLLPCWVGLRHWFDGVQYLLRGLLGTEWLAHVL